MKKKLIRFFKEFFNPKLKCSRLGHKEKSIIYDVRLNKSKSYRGVASDWEYEKKICKRCKEVLNPCSGLKHIHDIHEMTMPFSTMKMLEKNWAIQKSNDGDYHECPHIILDIIRADCKR